MRSILLTCLILTLGGYLAFAESGYPTTQYEAPYPASQYATTQYFGSQNSAGQHPAPTGSYPSGGARDGQPSYYVPSPNSYPPVYAPPTSGAEPWVRPTGYDEPGVYRRYEGDELLPPPEEVPLLPDDVAPAPPGAKLVPAPTASQGAATAPAADAPPAPAADGPSPADVKSLPLLDPFPSWLQFKDLNAAKLWSGTIQVGLNGAEGNAVTFNMTTGYDLKRETKQLILTSDLKYNNAASRQVETQNNAIFNGKAEWLFPASPWTAFARTYLEYDEFKAFDLRVVTNAGAGYRLINRERTKLTSRFGSGFSHEIGGPDDSYVPEAVFGMDFSHQFTPRQKFNAKGDYFPEWGEFTNYRAVTSADWELLFDQVANLSLKIGITDRYDSTPNGLKPNDFTYSTLILWKL